MLLSFCKQHHDKNFHISILNADSEMCISVAVTIYLLRKFTLFETYEQSLYQFRHAQIERKTNKKQKTNQTELLITF